MANFILGLFIIIVGGLVIYYSYDLVKWFGNIGWAEEWLGGTRQGYILIGMVIVIIGILFMFGVLDMGF